MTALVGLDKNKRLVESRKLGFQIIHLKLGFQWVSWVCSKRVSKCFEYKRSKPFFKSNY